ncbi:MAG: hypothetical protein COB12_08710 [Flavobacterium sp.]|nr:MAG: hypothetical protein COB12_08710 [Flavobacterium sp.]
MYLIIKNQIAFITLLLLMISCNSDDDNNYTATCNDTDVIINSSFYTSYLKITARYDYNDEWLQTNEYFFDEEGKVISAKYISTYNPGEIYISQYQYDNKGRLISEYLNNELSRTIKWTNNKAEVFNNENQKLTELVFCDNNLTEVRSGYFQNDIRYKKYNYDSNLNIISVENESEIRVEYLDYNTNKTNPYYLLKSIGVLIDWRNTLFSKNIFAIEKVYPYEGNDYSFPLTYYDYEYVFDNEGRVFEIEDDRTAIYVIKFEYE